MDLISQLLDEHQDYVIKLSALAEVIQGIRVNGRGDYFIATLDELLEAFTVHLEDHARREEEFLFPRLLERVPDSPVPVMLVEHQALRQQSRAFSHWYGVWRKGDEKALEKWAVPALDLRGQFSSHMQKENLIVFPLARRVLTQGEIEHWADLN